MNPKISVIIPCYNKGSLVEESIKSVLDSSYPNLEVIIVDDGSSDLETLNSLELISHLDENINIIRQKNVGVSIARNNGIQNSVGEFILFLDNDDLISPDYLQNAVTFLENNPKISFVYPDIVFFQDKIGLRRTQDYLIRSLKLYNFIPVSSVFRADKIRGVHLFNDNLNELEDWDFYLNLYKNGIYGSKLPGENYLFYRILGNSRNSNQVRLGHRLKSKLLVLKNNNIKLSFFELLQWGIGPIVYSVLSAKLEKKETLKLKDLNLSQIPNSIKNQLKIEYEKKI